MTWMTAARSIAAATSAMTMLFSAAQAVANDADVYVAVARDDVKPILIYIFSDSSDARFSPVDAMALYPDPEYTPAAGEPYNTTEGCRYTLEYDLDIGPYEVQPTPIYGPHSDQRSIDPISLPSYMAREGVKFLLEKNYMASQRASVPYFNCAGYVWANTIGADPKELERIIREEAERIRQGG